MAAPLLVPPVAVRLKNVLYATDFSEGSTHALPYVQAVAKAFGSVVYICHILAPTPLAAGAASPQLYEAAGKEASDQMAALLHSPALAGLEGKLVLAEGAIDDELVRVIREKNIDLVVAGTHGRTGLRKLLMGSVVEAICRVSTCPILTVGPGLKLQDGDRFKRILFPTDLSDESARVVPYLVLLARKYGSSLTVLHVMPEEAGVNPDARALSEPIRRRMMEEFEPTLANFRPEFIIEFGGSTETILRVADERNAGLIGMGIRNAFLPGIQLRSSTAYRIVAAAHCPVLTCR
jgi:nucleotide-binding universal stress UspA family protein